jgi:IclR family acetate operon transcriptional repressor
MKFQLRFQILIFVPHMELILMVTSISRADLIMELVGESVDGLTQTEINGALSFPKSSLSRMLYSLVELQYLSLTPSNRKYVLGPRLLTLAGRYLSRLDILEIGRAFVNRLTQETAETVTLSITHGWEMLVIAIENVPDAIIRPPQVGDLLPMYATALGKAVLAFLEDEEISSYLSSTKLRSFTNQTVTDQEVLIKELKGIRARGFAYCRQEFREYVVALAAPIFNFQGKAFAAISVSLLSLHATPEREKKILGIVRDTAESFSKKMGYTALNP